MRYFQSVGCVVKNEPLACMQLCMMQTVKGKVVGVTVTDMKGKPFKKLGQGAYFHPLICSWGQIWTLRRGAGLYWSPSLWDANANPSGQELESFSVLFGLRLSLRNLCVLGLCADVLYDSGCSSKNGKYIFVVFGCSAEKMLKTFHQMLIGRLPTACFMVDQHISWPTCCMLWLIWERSSCSPRVWQVRCVLQAVWVHGFGSVTVEVRLWGLFQLQEYKPKPMSRCPRCPVWRAYWTERMTEHSAVVLSWLCQYVPVGDIFELFRCPPEAPWSFLQKW